jgi:hypothetical protein
MVEYTEKWNGFQFRSPAFLGKPPKEAKDWYDLVKWMDYGEPMRIYDVDKQEYTIQKEHCFSVGELKWDENEDWFNFESVGTRFLQYYQEGLSEWIMEFVSRMYDEKYKDR